MVHGGAGYVRRSRFTRTAVSCSHGYLFQFEVL
ncbi:hypothetical protein M080_5668, partial [Bacteroides fragilis str. 3397 T10]